MGEHQPSLFNAAGTAPRSRRGGVRAGAGRPPIGRRAGSPHKARDELTRHHAVHVVLRVVREMHGLRKRKVFHAVRDATITVAKREDFRIVHLSIQRTHVHLLVEADDKMALARGMQGFQISAAKLMNAAVTRRGERRRRGQVFADRYHAEIIKNPRQARHALGYVLNNWRKHGEDRVGAARGWLVDPFSSGGTFPEWKELQGSPFMWKLRETYAPMVVWRPRSWLLREGWMTRGPISCRDVPGTGRSAE